jgi:hypothetical protein
LQDSITNLRDQLQASKNKFDIDIQPAKDKLAELKNSLSQGGAVKVLNQDLANTIKEAANKGIAEVDSGGMQNAMLGLYEKYGKIVSRGTLSTAFQNVIQAGIVDTTQASALVDRYINAASTSTNTNINLDDKITNLSGAFLSGNAAIGNQSGIGENFEQINKRGAEILSGERGENVKFDNLSKADQALARLKGTMEITTNRADGMTKALAFNEDGTINYAESIKKGYLAQEIFDAQQRKITQNIGGAVTPAYNDLLAALVPLLEGFSKFVKENPQLVIALTGIATALSGILTAGLGLRAFFLVFGPAISAISGYFATGAAGATFLSTALTVLSGPIGWLILGIGLLTAWIVYFWNTNEGFRNAIIGIWESVVKWFMWAKDNWLQALGQIIGFFISLPFKVGMYLKQLQDFIWDFFAKIDWGKLWGGLLDGVKSAWLTVVAFFSNINWGDLLKNVGNGFKDLFKGIFRGILSGIPGLNVDDTLKKIGLYANGGYFTKPTLGIFGEAGDEAILNMNAIRMLGLTPNSVQALNSGSVQNTNTSSVSGSYNQSSTNYVNNFGSIFGASSQYA